MLLDNSAWVRLARPDLPEARRDQLAAAMEQGELSVCLPFLLEAGYSARSREDHGEILLRLSALPTVRITEQVEARALAAQSELARQGHHRVAPSDLIIAACADSVGSAVLHYDRDFDIIEERTGLSFESEWLSPPGTLS